MEYAGLNLQHKEDYAFLMLRIYHGSDEEYPLGVPRDLLHLSNPRVAGTVETSLDKFRELGITVRDVETPYLKNLSSTFLAIIGAEASAYHEKWIRNGRLHEYGLDVRALVQLGFPILASQYLKAQRARAVIITGFAKLLSEVDVLALPTVPVSTPLLGQESIKTPGGDLPVLSALTLFTAPFNLNGFPALSIPNGFIEGLPSGLQLIGAQWEESLLTRIATSFQEVTDFHKQVAKLG